MLTRREFIAGAAKVFAGGVVAASGVLAIVPKAAKPKIFHGKQARMWVNDVEITRDIPPRMDTYQVLVQGPYLPSAKYPRTALTVDRQFLIGSGISPYLPRVGDKIYLADDSFFGMVVDD